MIDRLIEFERFCGMEMKMEEKKYEALKTIIRVQTVIDKNN
jgi:hypothetical protein